uniref:Uncharacterized protein n=1 Tax=Romanomermis culicivorax TaxID=13658 RepID=A0A915IY02_ROMCU
MSTPGHTVPIVMDKICRKFDETDEILRSRQNVPDWAVALFIFCSLASVLCLLIDVLLIRKKAFRSLAKNNGQRGRSLDGCQKRSDNVQVVAASTIIIHINYQQVDCPSRSSVPVSRLFHEVDYTDTPKVHDSL